MINGLMTGLSAGTPCVSTTVSTHFDAITGLYSCNMLGMTDYPIEEAIAAFAEFGVEAAYIVPTETGLNKAIIDAHSGVRDYLKNHNIHDFDLQGQGNDEHGVKVDVNVVTESSVLNQQLSLYRPKTKSGDPRLWTNIKHYANAFNLLALFTGSDGKLYLVNCSNPAIFETRKVNGSFLNSILGASSKSPNSNLLLELLKEIASRGWIDATRHGDTGVGHTLETLLGIEANSSKRPDFLDEIELKSNRMPSSGKARNKSTMLSKVPNWKTSPMKAAQILDTFGEPSPSTGRQELYVTVSEKPNRQGLYLIYDEKSGSVENRFAAKDGTDTLVVRWNIADLQEDLKNKHKETFWVKAETRKTEHGSEQFKYLRVTRTLRPLVANIGPLINAGKITLDFTLSEKATGGVRDHGYLFRIWPKDLGLLFPAVENYELI